MTQITSPRFLSFSLFITLYLLNDVRFLIRFGQTAHLKNPASVKTLQDIMDHNALCTFFLKCRMVKETITFRQSSDVFFSATIRMKMIQG